MTLANLCTILKSIPDMSEKVTYRAFPVGAAPELPFICYLETNTNNFMADGKVYKTIREIDIELYTSNKDVDTEQAVETVLADNCLAWDKDEDYLDDEHCYMTTYTITIQGD